MCGGGPSAPPPPPQVQQPDPVQLPTSGELDVSEQGEGAKVKEAGNRRAERKKKRRKGTSTLAKDAPATTQGSSNLNTGTGNTGATGGAGSALNITKK